MIFNTASQEDLNKINSNLTELQNARVVYNANIDSLDVYVNGSIVGSLYCGFSVHALVPIMTSNSTPSGLASASTEYGIGLAFKAFDGDDNTRWSSNSGSATQSLTYAFDTAKKISKYKIVSNGTDRITSWDLRASNDNSQWTVLGTYTRSSIINEEIDVTTTQSYKYYQIYVTGSARGISTAGCAIETVQYYGA